PIIILAEQMAIGEEKTYRALALSNLLTIYQKSHIGRLSPFCGVVSAGAAAGGAITYLFGGGKDAIAETLNNTLANVAGIICDGAKATCAMKICSALDAGWLASKIAIKHRNYPAGTGIIGKSADDTIISAGKLATEGMVSTEEHLMNTILRH
ncbi:MAG TPA: L-serine ammonia-lyase, iron-sulfur-dependent, subunit alpha, partial [Candidatus Izemoplasmatales bacterium]|nr:L-serine ammonia-lyase, iron-sulfur-dependent, subunit alpha [Candidatus Izemoplasmatales bacterium]